MPRAWKLFASGLLLVIVVGCYHATIETGLAPSSQTIEKSFASGFLYGLIPPSTVETAAKCPHGVARVETQLSFVNQLVGWLTLYLYTPMSIKVTCAETGHASVPASTPRIDIGANPTPAEMRKALRDAADLSLRRQGPVEVAY